MVAGTVHLLGLVPLLLWAVDSIRKATTIFEMLNISTQSNNFPDEPSNEEGISIPSDERSGIRGDGPPGKKRVLVNYSDVYETFDALVIVDSRLVQITLRETLGEEDRARAIEILLSRVEEIDSLSIFSWELSEVQEE